METVFKTFTTPKGCYLFDRNTNSILNINTSEYEALNNKNHPEHDTIVTMFQNKGYCLKGKLSTIEHPQSKQMEYHLKNRVEQITMQVTQNCNLRCEYCSYSGNYDQRTHTNKTMDLKTMYKCVDFIMRHSRDLEKISIGFYGGEPLLMINNIQQCVAYIQDNYPERNIHYTLTTNGTLLNDKNLEFLQDAGFHIMISLDGPAFIHDRHRKFADGSGSFDTIIRNVEYIREKFPKPYKNVSFNAVINPDTDYSCVKNFFDAETVLQDSSIKSALVNDVGAKEAVVHNDYYFITYRYERMKLLLYMLGLTKKESVSKLLYKELSDIKRTREHMTPIKGLPETTHHGGPCIPGSMRLFVDVDGNFYPCERVSESSDVMRIGHIDEGINIEKAEKLLNIGRLTEDECLHCWNLMHCSMCAAHAYKDGELSRNTKLTRCEMMKADTLEKMRILSLFREMNINLMEVEV
jgi:uncharacterized protein